MNYVFVFLGEFGYELFNWQGVIRKLSTQISKENKIICCSRANLYPLYEYADKFIDISNLKLFRESIASGYFAFHPQQPAINSSTNILFDISLKTEVMFYVNEALRGEGAAKNNRNNFIFSSDYLELPGLSFGCKRDLYGVDYNHAQIYEGINVENNLYSKIEVRDDIVKEGIEARLGWKLSEPYILFQHRERDIVIRSAEKVRYQQLLKDLSKRYKIVLLSFKTGRNRDSFSQFGEFENCYNLSVSSFPEQAILINYSVQNIFTTEGDFGSHSYVPPFMGKDVITIAPRPLYNIGTTPISIWNEKVFRFGGHIHDFVAEDVLDSPSGYKDFLEFITGRIDLTINLQRIENTFNNSNFDDYYLWPRTPKTHDHQDKIRERVGVDDYTDAPSSRSNLIIGKLQELVTQGMLREDFSLVDIASGDSIVIWRIKKEFVRSECVGIDCLKDHFGTHKEIRKDGVKIYAGFLQHMFFNYYDTRVDVALMLNSYRGWESADLRESELEIPQLIDRWFSENTKFTFVTATQLQIEKLTSLGFEIDILGKGEDASFMICISKGQGGFKSEVRHGSSKKGLR